MPSGRCCGWWNDWEQPRSSATLPARSRHHHPGIASSKTPPAPPTHLATAHGGSARGARAASARPNKRTEQLRRRPRADDRGPHGGAPSAVGSGLESGPNESARVIRRGSLQHRCHVPRHSSIAVSAGRSGAVLRADSAETVWIHNEKRGIAAFSAPSASASTLFCTLASNVLHLYQGHQLPQAKSYWTELEFQGIKRVCGEAPSRKFLDCASHSLHFRDSPYLHPLAG